MNDEFFFFGENSSVDVIGPENPIINSPEDIANIKSFQEINKEIYEEVERMMALPWHKRLYEIVVLIYKIRKENKE